MKGPTHTAQATVFSIEFSKTSSFAILLRSQMGRQAAGIKIKTDIVWGGTATAGQVELAKGDHSRSHVLVSICVYSILLFCARMT